MQKNNSNPDILIADAQFLIIEGLKVFLGERYRIIACLCSKYELLRALKVHVPDYLILDYFLLDFDGFNDLKELKDRFPNMAIIILTNDITHNELTQLKNIGIRNILHK